MSDYERIADVIRYLDANRHAQPGLDELAEHLALSPPHFQRLFSRWAGVSPKAFLRCLTVTDVKQRLRDGESVLDAAYATGLSGPGRLHDLCVDLEAASPGEIKRQGQGWTLDLGFAETPFGTALVANGPRGVCHLSFPDHNRREAAEEEVSAAWANATFNWNDQVAESIAEQIFTATADSVASETPTRLRCFVRGTRFQVRVWRALLELPPGGLVSYGQLAARIGCANAARAVGSAVAKNSLAVLIPCHRVIRETGISGQYRWGPERKRALIAWEGCRLGEVQRSAR